MAKSNSTGSRFDEAPESPSGPVDHLQAADLHVGSLREMLVALVALCRANDAATNLNIQKFGTLVEHLSERGVALCHEAQDEMGIVFKEGHMAACECQSAGRQS